jgi:acetyl esterase/lipase
MRIFKDIPYVENGHKEQKLTVYLPDEGAGFPLFIYFHGGGFVSGGCIMYGKAAETLTRHGIAVCSVGYRIYPEATYPDFIRDGAMGVAYIKKHLAEYGIGDRIFIGGTSAGAYLSMMLAFDPRFFAMHNLKPTDFAGFFHHTGQPTTHFNVLRERGMDYRRAVIDEAAPLYFAGMTELKKPLLIVYYQNDMPCRPEQNILMYKSLLRFQPDAKVEIAALPGGHCAGSSHADETGEFPYMRELVRFVKGL